MDTKGLQQGYSLKEIQKQISKLPRVSLANLPTRLEECSRLTQTLGGPTDLDEAR